MKTAFQRTGHNVATAVLYIGVSSDWIDASGRAVLQR